ncbi:RidA family protein [Cupriavidus sp. 2TAF22]|uniref:RidA family protein n=1 Tax=unclassified Cupriavidus TaxID=2640874 RepID=UPI003F91AFF5
MQATSTADLPRRLTMLNPIGLYDPGANGYSHVAMIPPGAGLICVAGQGGERADGSLPDSFDAQVRQALDNLRVALAAAGAQLRQVARLTVLVVDHSEARLAVLSRELGRAWGEAPKPACTLIPVPRLALDGMLFEIEALAVAQAPHAA